MKKQILFLFLQMIVAVSILLASIPLRDKMVSEFDNINSMLAYSGLEIKSNDNGYTVINNSNVNTSGKLLVKIQKGLRNKNIKIKTDKYTCYLDNIFYLEDEVYDIYLIDNFNLNNNESKNYNISFESDSNLLSGNVIKYKLEIEPNTI